MTDKNPHKGLFVYEAVCEDLSGLGGPMGTETVKVMWRQFYSTRELGKQACEADYAYMIRGRENSHAKLRWTGGRNGSSTNDLSFCMYHVTRKAVLDEVKPPVVGKSRRKY